jgi:hypothetical protein
MFVLSLTDRMRERYDHNSRFLNFAVGTKFRSAPQRGSEEQCSEVWRLADDGARGVHAVDLGGKGEPGETTMEAVLSVPCCALVMESEAISTPGMTDEVVHGTKPIKRTAELTVEKRMKALASGGG